MKDKSVNIAQIAKIAGVHSSTVSRALNDSPLVKPETRKWIQELARKNGYIPDALAQSLIKGKTYTLGTIVPEISNTFYSHIVDTLESNVYPYGYSLLLCNSRFDSETEYKAIQTLLGKRVDALVICAPQETDRLIPLAEKLPIILCDVTEKQEHFDSVSVDETAGIRDLIDHLLSRGHTRFGYIADRVTWHRGDIFRRILTEKGCSISEEHCVNGDALGAQCGYDAMVSLQKQSNLPTAMFAARDNIAVGVMRAAVELQIDIPREMALAGYDDLTISSFLHKTLTTVHQPADIIGQVAAEHLLYQLGHTKTAPQSDAIIPNLIIRETT